MSERVGFELVVETGNAKSKLDDIGGSVKRLTDNVRESNSSNFQRLTNNANMPSFLGDGRGTTGLLASASSVPSFMSSQSMYGSINSFNGQMSPGGIMRDGRRVQSINTEEIQDQLDDLGVHIKEVTANINEARARNDTQSQLTLSRTRSELYDQQKYLQGQLRTGERDANKADITRQAGRFAMTQALPDIARAVIGSMELMRSGRLTRAQGDYLGADVMETKGKGELTWGTAGAIAGGGIGLLSNLLLPGSGLLVGSILSPVLQQAGKYFGGSEGAELEENLAYSKRYKDALPDIESFYQRFGMDINDKSAEENSRVALDWFGKATATAYGTGHDAFYLMEAARNRGAYGNLTGDQALSMGRQDVMWERYTGANLANIQRLAGTAMRYGGDENAIQKAFAGLKVSGMGKGQFDEFLTSMQHIMEDGIENGFVRGADEIAGNMTLLSKLSGGSALWTGEQGASRLMKMNQSIASATDLDSVEDMIVFSVADQMMKNITNEKEMDDFLGEDAVYTGTYADTMQLVEQGLKNPVMLRNLMQSVRQMEQGNTMGEIERYQTMFGLNYSGASKIWQMSRNKEFMADPEKYAKEVEQIQTNPENKSDSAKLYNVMNKLYEDGIKTGKIHFDDTELTRLEKIASDMRASFLTSSGEVQLAPNDMYPANPEIAGTSIDSHGGEYNVKTRILGERIEEIMQLKGLNERSDKYRTIMGMYNSMQVDYTASGSRYENRRTKNDGTTTITGDEYGKIVNAIKEGFKGMGIIVNFD
jgi:hypothetical protein